MKIIYLISMLIIIIQGILIKKTDKKLNILIVVPIVVMVYICYISIIADILYIIGIKINSISVGLINIAVSVILSIIMIKQKSIQRFSIYKSDILAILILVILAGFTTYKFFGCFNTIKYLTDGIVHYTAAKQFSINEKLFKNASSRTFYVNPLHMPLAYINEGLLMNSLVDYIGQVGTVSLYLFIDTFMWMMCGYSFFYVIRNKIKGKIKYIIAIILTLLYCFGYPLNSLVVGFHYLNYAIVLISLIIVLVNNQAKIKEIYFIITIMLFNVGIMFSYYLFAPIIYGAIFIWYLCNFKISKKMIYYTLITLVIPGIIGLQYYFLDKGMDKILSGGINAEGTIMRNTWTGLVLYVPFMLYYIYSQIRQKKKDMLFYMIGLSIIQTLAIYILNKNGKISTYYFYKMYYILQLFVLSATFFGMVKIMKQEKFLKYVCLGFVAVIGISAILSSTSNMIIKDVSWGIGKDRLSEFVEVYYVNKWVINRKKTTIATEDFENLKNIEKNIVKEFDNTIVISPNIGFYLVFDYRTEKDCVEKWNNNKKYKYYINFGENINNKINLNETQEIYKNNNVTIYKKDYN